MSDEPPEVRLLPMSDRQRGFVGRSIEAVQRDFFLGRLVKGGGRWRYASSGLVAEPGTAVLFQFKARVIASAVLLRNEKYDKPRSGDAGELRLDPASVRVFTPWDAEMLRSVWPGFRAFGHVKQRLSPGNYGAFVARQTGVRARA
jgi:hypothetical protein